MVNKTMKHKKEISKRKKFWLRIWSILEGICAIGTVLFCVFTFMVLVFLMVYVFKLPATFVWILGISTILWILSKKIRGLSFK